MEYVLEGNSSLKTTAKTLSTTTAEGTYMLFLVYVGYQHSQLYNM